MDVERVVQIGLRGSGYTPEDFDRAPDRGFRVVQAEECWHRSLEPLMDELREGLEIIGGCRGLDIEGTDVVEVAPAYDTSGKTAPWGPTCSSRCCVFCRVSSTAGTQSNVHETEVGFIDRER